MMKNLISSKLIAPRFPKYRLETGFSMLEAVVVVGVLLALAVGGFFAYGPITENAKKAKVKSSASEVHTGVLVASMDGDPATNPQDVIDTWNGSTTKIRVEILEPETSLGAMTTAAPTADANGDYCVQATNVESPHITAREGACDDVIPNGEDAGGTPPPSKFVLVPNGDIDLDGKPNSTDTDIDGDGILNELDTTPNGDESIPEDITSAGKGDGTSSTTVGTISGDGSGNFIESVTNYNHSHEPLSSNMLAPGETELTGWTFDPANPSSVKITVWTDGKRRGVGGSNIVAFHADTKCVYPSSSSMNFTTVRRVALVLKEPYVGNDPGPNSAATSIGCGSGYIIQSVVLRAQTQQEWETYSLGSLSYVWTRDIVESWSNPSIK